jgi:long-chain acyl-CoA synthetase
LNEKPSDISDLTEIIKLLKPSVFPSIPSIYNAFVNRSDELNIGSGFGSLKVCISGSASLNNETKTRFEEMTGCRIIEGYGLSEAPTATHCNPVRGINKAGSIGLPLPGVDCRIKPDLKGKAVMEANIEGELIIKGPQVMPGYFRQDDETKKTIQDGWLHTGDIVLMDEDGYFWVKGRNKDLIKVGGLQVWPVEVEAVLMKNPFIKECVVAGIPEATLGEVVKAWVILDDNADTNENEIIKFCEKFIARYKVPAEIEVVDSLPKSTVGKVIRYQLVEKHLEDQKKVIE